MVLAPRTVQNMPDRLSRVPIKGLQPDSITPRTDKQFLSSEAG